MIFIYKCFSLHEISNELVILKCLHLAKKHGLFFSYNYYQTQELTTSQNQHKSYLIGIVKSHTINYFLFWDPIVLKVRLFELWYFGKRKKKLSPRNHKLSMNFVFDKPKEISVTCVSKAMSTCEHFQKSKY